MKNNIILMFCSPKNDGKFFITFVNFLPSRFYVIQYAKQKHPGCKKSARPIRSSIANRYVRPKTLISVEAKKLLIKNLFNYLNDIQ